MCSLFLFHVEVVTYTVRSLFLHHVEVVTYTVWSLFLLHVEVVYYFTKPAAASFVLLLGLASVVRTLSGRTGSALVWHTRGRAFQSRLVQQVLRFVGRVNTVQYVELRGYCP